MEERRKYPRFQIMATPVQFISENDMNNGRIEDISGGGCRLRSSVPMSKDIPLIMQFSIEDTNVIVKAKPIWSAHIPEEESYQVGVIFTDIPQQTRNKIVEFVSQKIELSI